ncbi:MAG: ABC transporter ATP-binding protein [Actinobacteria bacterium]|nr:ABC transporter ATP-binding protein [Actinomycetota bacterium]
MPRLIKYLKPFVFLIIIAIALLFIQAMADLALPDYMSGIVNVGIQQGGIKDAVPQAVSKSHMDRLVLFMDRDESQLVFEEYRLIDKNSKDYKRYLKDYPAVEKEPVYVLTGTSRDTKEELNKIMGRALLAVFALEQAIADPSKAEALGDMPGIDFSKIPEGASAEMVFSMLAGLGESQLASIRKTINSQFDAMGQSIITQSAVMPIKAEYIALGADTGRLQSAYIGRTGLIMLLLSLLSAASTVAVGFLAARVAAGLSRNLREKVFDKVMNFSNAEFDKFSTASLITRSTNDITQVQMLVIIIIRIVFYAPILGIGGIIRALEKSASMSWIIAVAVIVILSLILLVFSITMPRFRRMQLLLDRINLIIREGLSGMMVIRAFNNQGFEEKRFDNANNDLTRTSLFVNRAMVVMMPAMMLLMNGLSVLIIWVGAHQVAQSRLQVGDMMAFLQYAMLIVMSFLMMSVMFIMIPRASVSAGRVADVLDVEPAIKDPGLPIKPEEYDSGKKGLVEFIDVCFRYPNAEKDMLHDISFVAKPGQTTAIIGSTGSGKSTITNLLLRFYDVNSGSVLVDGIDIRQYSQNDLREKIGYIPQKSVLFSGTVESNLKLSDENAGIEKLKEAVEMAQALDFINEKAKGFGAEISQGGKNVSGGQRQRLSIARALVKNPQILVLDDCFSALDFKTDKALRNALKNYSSSTILIVAQRIGTVMNAEQIIVVDEGRIAGKGTHKELMNSCQAYREIAYSQLSEEELA